jgi:hypothetical protein
MEKEQQSCEAREQIAAETRGSGEGQELTDDPEKENGGAQVKENVLDVIWESIEPPELKGRPETEPEQGADANPIAQRRDGRVRSGEGHEEIVEDEGAMQSGSVSFEDQKGQQEEKRQASPQR